MKKIFIFLALAILLSGCAPSPVSLAKADKIHAEAYAIRSETDQVTLDADQAREQKIKMDEIAIQDAEREQVVKDAGLANAKRAAGWIAYWGGLALTFSLVMMILAVGASGSVAIYGSGRAVARAAMVKANLIYLDKATGQYPLVLEYAGKGIVSLTDPNTGATLLLNTRNEPDRLMIQSAAAIRHVGVLASASSKSKDPTGVAMVQPLIIDAEEK
jgi:outer membrane murein-binding lipoprotein Lpp